LFFCIVSVSFFIFGLFFQFFLAFVCKVEIEVKKPGQSEEKQMQEKIEKINQK